MSLRFAFGGLSLALGISVASHVLAQDPTPTPFRDCPSTTTGVPIQDVGEEDSVEGAWSTSCNAAAASAKAAAKAAVVEQAHQDAHDQEQCGPCSTPGCPTDCEEIISNVQVPNVDADGPSTNNEARCQADKRCNSTKDSAGNTVWKCTASAEGAGSDPEGSYTIECKCQDSTPPNGGGSGGGGAGGSATSIDTTELDALEDYISSILQ